MSNKELSPLLNSQTIDEIYNDYNIKLIYQKEILNISIQQNNSFNIY